MISRGHIVSLRKNVVIRPYLAYHREGVIRRHFCRQMAQTSFGSRAKVISLSRRNSGLSRRFHAVATKDKNSRRDFSASPTGVQPRHDWWVLHIW